MFLYILNMPKYGAIKIGVAKGYSRIKQHLETYGDIDFERSYIVHAKNGDTIRTLEKQLLEDYIEYKVDIEEIMNKDGYTEIRRATILNDVLDDIEFKSQKFKDKEIKIIKGIKINKPIRNHKDSRVKIEKLKTINGLGYNLSLLEMRIIYYIINYCKINETLNGKILILDIKDFFKINSNSIYDDCKKSVIHLSENNNVFKLISYDDVNKCIMFEAEDLIKDYYISKKSIGSFKCKYSFMMYYLINKNNFKNFEINLTEFRYILGVKAGMYSGFNSFKNQILKSVIKELNDILDDVNITCKTGLINKQTRKVESIIIEMTNN